MKWFISTRARVGLALCVASSASVALWLISVARNHSWFDWYMVWNLFLAWVPLLLVVRLEITLRRKLWSSWSALLITVAFVLFLPNTFYLVTDFIHLHEMPRADLVFDTVMFASFALNAFLLGLIELFMFHVELRRRLSVIKSWGLLTCLILLTSFAIYIGRDLRWNTWDIILNPASILFEVSDRLLAPAAHPGVVTTTVSFFVLITSLYVVFWHLFRIARQQKFPE